MSQTNRTLETFSQALWPEGKDSMNEQLPTQEEPYALPHKGQCEDGSSWRPALPPQMLGLHFSQCQEHVTLSNGYGDANDDSQDENSDRNTDGNHDLFLPRLLLIL